MKVVFRTDASLRIGTGHAMRCLTLAEALRSKGASCVFACRTHPGNLIQLIRRRGVAVRGLSSDPRWRHGGDALSHSDWLGASWQTDAEQLAAALGDERFDWLVVDHYALDSRWEARMRKHCRRIMVIDDLADRDHDCDLLLDQNLGRTPDDYRARVPDTCRCFVGPDYALLRPEFAALREISLTRRRTPFLNHLMITMGGVDEANTTGKVLSALKTVRLPEDCRITVVMGGQAPWLGDVRKLAAEMPWNTEIRVDISDMAQVMAEADLAIGAAGSTSWERCCLGLPSVIVVLAANQLHIGEGLAARNAAIMARLDSLEGDLRDALRRFRDEPGLLARMSAAAAAISGGNGADDIADVIGVLRAA